jgi:hypothetical protein
MIGEGIGVWRIKTFGKRESEIKPGADIVTAWK